MTNRNLPILKFILFPFVAISGYAAYSYYYQEYLQNENKALKHNLPILFMNELFEALKESKTVPEIKQVYYLMRKHIDQFVIDPSLNAERLVLKKKDNVFGSNLLWGLSPRSENIEKFDVNTFNSREEKKVGNYFLGTCTSYQEMRNWNLSDVDALIDISKKAINKRKKKCEEIAHNGSSSLANGYLEQYTECLKSTLESSIKMERQIDLIDKTLKYQLLK